MPDALLQHFTISIPLMAPVQQIQFRDGIFSEGPADAVIISTRNMDRIFRHYQNSSSQKDACLLGSPVINQNVDLEQAAKFITEAEDSEKAILSLNGEFLAFLANRKSQEFHLFTDRFSSYPLFWASNGRQLLGSYNYTDLAKACRNWQNFSLRPEKAYEFFKLQRLMGDETHDTLSKCLPSAAHLKIDGEKISICRYWRQNYKKSEDSRSSLARQFSSLIKKSVQMRRDTHHGSTGVFLSGGHDSRMIACFSGEETSCYTLGFHENFEVSCARNIAETLGQNHTFVSLPDDYFLCTLNTSTYMSGGMYANDHALFVPANRDVNYTPVLLHGHGLDYMFQGMYLHTSPLMLMGRPTYIRREKEFPPDLSQHFIDSISFRLKFPFEQEWGRAEAIKSCGERLYETVHKIESQGRDITDDPSSIWEYLIFHQPSRHYTFTNILSKRLCGEVRTPSFDNDVYDFYMALPDKRRIHADMMRDALYGCNRKVAEIPAGNHGIAAGWGPYKKTSALIGRKILRHLTGEKRYYAPADSDRTWPDRNTYLKTHAAYLQAALAPLHDKEFQDFLDFIDWNKLQEKPEHFLEQNFGGAFWISMLSYYRFYKLVHT